MSDSVKKFYNKRLFRPAYVYTSLTILPITNEQAWHKIKS